MRDTHTNGFFDNLIIMDELLTLLRGQATKRTVYRWVQRGMPRVRIGGRLWFDKREVASWLKRSS